MKYVYQRTGAPLLSWKNAPPQQTRAADTKALGCGCGAGLGSLEGSTLSGPTVSMPLPRAGAPEPIPDVMTGRAAGTALSDFPGGTVGKAVALAAAGFLALKLLKKKPR
jgi:hypothetical protein